jgi:hypothetical protein
MLINHNGGKVKLPDFLIVGAAKSGTTSLHYYLKQHPDIFMPVMKELRFLIFMDNVVDFVRYPWLKGRVVSTLEEYAKQFEKAKDNNFIGEACPFYLYAYKDVIRNIKVVYGKRAKDLKILIILRDPTERAWSQFIMHRRDGIESIEDFKEAIRPEVVKNRLRNIADMGYDYVGLGKYYDQIIAFMDEFPLVKIFLFEDLCQNRLKLVKEIFLFLGVDEGYVPDVKRMYNITGESKIKFLTDIVSKQYPSKNILKTFIPNELRQKIKNKIYEINIEKKPIPHEIRRDLIDNFKDDILKIEGLIRRDLSSWLKV